MNRIIPWATAVALLGLFITVYLIASTNAEEITRTLPTQKIVSPVVLNSTDDSRKPTHKDPAQLQLALLDRNTAGQVKTATVQETTGKSSIQFIDMYEHYGPKHSALSVDKTVFDNAPKEIVENVWDRWLNIDEGYLTRHTHWHKADRGDVTFDNFTNALHFFPADQKFSKVTAVCKKRSNYNELLIYTDGKKWLDLNQERSNSYSVTLWDWYNTVAIKSGDATFIDHRKPKVYRWNAPVAASLAAEILETGAFEVYVEGNQSRSHGVMMTKKEKKTNQVFPNLNLRTSVTIQNIDEVRGCFGARKQFVKDQAEKVSLNSDVFGLIAYFEDKT